MINLNDRFGRLVVIDLPPESPYAICKCDCGTVTRVRKNTLTCKKHPTRSCGCLQKEKARKTGVTTIGNNSEQRIATNMRYNTNFQVIENPNPPKNNRSGCKGVWWDHGRGLWAAYITLHGKRHHLGRYHKYEDAVKARKAAEEEMYSPLIEAKNNEDGVE